MNGPERKKFLADPKDVREFKCPKCGGNVFEQVYIIGQLSKLAPSNPTGVNLLQPQPRFRCAQKKCKHLLKEVVPG